MKKDSQLRTRYRAVVTLLILSLLAGSVLIYLILASLPSHHSFPF